MDRDEVRERVHDYSWYHTIDLGQGVVTPGQYDHRPLLNNYGIPSDLSGKSVLDVGPAQGFFAFEFEERGAVRVATAELPRWSDHDGSPALKEDFLIEAVDLRNEDYLHNALAFAIEARQSRVEQLFCNIYDLSPESLGMFDITFCGSLLIHLTDPLRALYALHSVTSDYSIITTVIDPSRRGARRPLAYFHATEKGQAFWSPNMKCLESWALAAGYRRVERVSTFVLRSLDGEFSVPHGTIKAYIT